MRSSRFYAQTAVLVLLLSKKVLVQCYSISLNNSDPFQSLSSSKCSAISTTIGEVLDTNATTQTASLEVTPDSFECQVAFKPRCAMLYSIDVLVVLVSSLTYLALRKFEDPVDVWRYSLAEMELRFSSTKRPGHQGFQNKSIMWSIRFLACWFDSQDRYGEISGSSRFEPEPVIGFMQLASLQPRQNQQSLGSNYSFSDAIRSMETSSKASQSVSHQVNAEITVTNFALLHPRTMVYFRPYQIYATLIDLLITLAEYDSTAAHTSIIAYNPDADIGFVIGATSRAATEIIPFWVVIAAIQDLAQKMPSMRRPDARWTKFTFLVRNDGRIVGRGTLKKGRVESAAAQPGFIDT